MSSRTIALLVLAVIAATALTVEVTYFILDRFVLHNPNDPLTIEPQYVAGPARRWAARHAPHDRARGPDRRGPETNPPGARITQ